MAIESGRGHDIGNIVRSDSTIMVEKGLQPRLQTARSSTRASTNTAPTSTDYTTDSTYADSFYTASAKTRDDEMSEFGPCETIEELWPHRQRLPIILHGRSFIGLNLQLS